jgi:hypothetical protein
LFSERFAAQIGDAQYYSVGAQLGSSDGVVTVAILVNGQVISTGTASGPSNGAEAQICQGSTTGEWVRCN